MTCQKCGATINENAKFCKFCGTKTENTNCQYGDNISNSAYDSSSCHTKQYNYSYNYSNKTKPTYNLNASHQEQYDYSAKFNYIKTATETYSEDEYLENYIGANYNAIKNQKFSFSTLLFGEIYLIYRKLWFQAFTCFLFSLLSILYLKDNYTIIAIIAIRIFYGLNFRETYINIAEKRVEQIKQSNLDKNSQELLKYCKKKGKPITAIPILIAIIAFIIFTVVLPMYYEQKQLQPIPEIPKQDEEIILPSSLSYSIPNGFVKSNTDINAKNYLYSVPNTLEICRIMIWEETTDKYPTEESIINNNFKRYTNIENNSINLTYFNNKTWKSTYTEKVYTEKDIYKIAMYATKHNNRIYAFETYHNMTNSYVDNVCEQQYQKFINSININ